MGGVHNRYDRRITGLVYRQRGPGGWFVRCALRVLGVHIPPEVALGPGLQLLHVGSGHVLHPRVELGTGVTLGPGVTVGKADLHGPASTRMRIVLGDGVVVGAGAVVLARHDQQLTIGAGAQIGANAVVLTDVPAGEVWVGNPARPAKRRTISLDARQPDLPAPRPQLR